MSEYSSGRSSMTDSFIQRSQYELKQQYMQQQQQQQSQSKEIRLLSKQRETDNQAHKLFRQNKFQKAAKKWQSLIKKREKKMQQGSVDQIVLDWKIDRINCLKKLGKLQEVQRETAELLTQRNKIYDEEEQQSLNILGSYAKTLHNLGKFQKAEAKYRHLIHLRQKTLGQQHPKTLSAIHNLGMNYQRTNRIQDAREVLFVAIEGMIKKLEDDDQSLLFPLLNFCIVLKLCNQNESSIKYLNILIQRSRLIQEQKCSFQYQFKGYKFLAEVYESIKRYKEGVQAYNKAIDIARNNFDKKDTRMKETIKSRDACKQMIPQYNFYIR